MAIKRLSSKSLPHWLRTAVSNARLADGVTQLAATFTLSADWAEPIEELGLAAVYEIGSGANASLRALVTDKIACLEQALASGPASLHELSNLLQSPVLDCSVALELQTVHIAKPWGKEIWYTGIEQRGVCQIGADGRYCPLPWAIAALPGFLLGPDERSPVLLKILDPLPEPVFGDLYFELHEVKREVYVVTRVDPACWPDGQGAIRIGFDQRKRRAYAGDEDFKRAYADAVASYREVRKKIDAGLDRQRESLGIAASAVVSAEQTRRWLTTISPNLLEQEKALRQSMDEFTALHPLAVGDVVVIPQRLPHALQHGVRTIEFQTPVYERQIVSFAQKVLTQSLWDTAAAMTVTRLDPYVNPEFVVETSDGWQRSRVVDFDDFSVWRVTLDRGAVLRLQGDAYKLLIAITGTLRIGAVDCQPEQALLVPGHALPVAVKNVQAASAIALIAAPKQPKAS